MSRAALVRSRHTPVSPRNLKRRRMSAEALTPFAERGKHGTAVSQIAASWHIRTLR
jgi:hypothetical protein